MPPVLELYAKQILFFYLYLYLTWTYNYIGRAIAYAFVFSDYSIDANFQHLSFISNTI